MPDRDYFNIKGVSNSMLKAFDDDPLKCYQQYVSRELPMDESTASMRWGTLFETWIFDMGRIVEIPNSVLSRTGSRAGSAWKQFHADHPMSILVKSTEVESLRIAEKNIVNHDAARKLIFNAGGLPWQVCQWIDDETTLECKCEIDRVLPGAMLVDLKTSKSIAPDKFLSQAHSLRYHRQAQFYATGWEQCHGDLLEMAFVAVKNTPSYSVEVFHLTEGFIALAQEENRSALRRIAESFASGKWNTPTHGTVIELDAPAWAYRQAIVGT